MSDGLALRTKIHHFINPWTVSTSGKQLEHCLTHQDSKLDGTQIAIIDVWSPLNQARFTTQGSIVGKGLQAQGDWQEKYPDTLSAFPFLDPCYFAQAQQHRTIPMLAFSRTRQQNSDSK